MIRTLSFITALSITLQLAAFDLNVNIQHAVCDAPTGSIWVAPSGGSAPYTFVWSTGANSATIFDVSPGIYNVTVTDSNGDVETEEIELLELDVLFPPFAATAYSCDDGCNGYLNQNMPLSGGTTYTVVFDPPGPQGGASPNGIYFSGFCIGTEYTATVTNSEGCTGVVGPITVEGPMQPELLSTTVTGSCPGGATGSVTLVFDQIGFIYISGLADTLPEITNPYTITNLAPGEYSGFAMAPTGTISCESIFSFVIPETTDPCGQLSGVAFADLDGDCIQDAGEVGIPYAILSMEPGEHLVITDASGNFSTEFPYAIYDLNTTFTDYTSDCVVLPYSFTLDAGNMSENVVLPLAPQFGPDVSVFVSAGVHVPGFEVNYHVGLSNQGPYSFNGMTLDLMFDPLLIPGPVEGSPVLVAPGHYQWTGLDLTAFESIQFEVEFTVPPDANLLGTSVTGITSVTGNTGDEDPSNDSYSITRVIVGAFDPNDKLVQTSSGASGGEYYLDLDSYVDYTIRFQNTGTAPAINVYLLDTISMDLDLLSLEILGSSHSFTPTIQPDRVLRFDFPGIMLPDSSADLAGSQGFVSFRLKPVDGLEIGTYLVNAADIFFDFNEPIRTNDAVLTVDVTVGIEALASPQLTVFPNPADDLVQVHVGEGEHLVELHALDGRRVLMLRSTGPLLTIPVSALASGHYLISATGRDGSRSMARFVRQ